MPNKLPIWDQRMLQLMEYCMTTNKVKTQGAFLKSIGMNETAVYQVKRSTQSFRLDHLLAAGKKYQVNMNWIFGFEYEMFSSKNKRTSIALLKEAVQAVEQEFKTKINR